MKSLQIKSDDQLNEMAEDVGFDPEDAENFDEEAEREDYFKDHPMRVDHAGDVMKVMSIVDYIQDKIEEEEADLEEELKAVKEFRRKRIKSREKAVNYLTMPLKKFIDDWGENYNGPAGHAGYHTITTTDWKATADELVAFATEHGLQQKITIKAELTQDQLQAILDVVGNADPEADVSQKAYKGAIKDFMREQGLHGAPYSESGEQIDSNPLYAIKKRKDFRIKPND